ncbi:MAG TPA: flagellar biosynthetic protein FliR [Pirellulaceae bacterium]|nr:flagellar biosynthetic protein FliR [Pirellulaceae bacterium]HMO92633.1 flagellar biosynthetic protein FliR [Pirellulaceae bacterium]HMP70219.1 flagellar biosynthetic protein FliR [Pirellulaceae bacterium]
MESWLILSGLLFIRVLSAIVVVPIFGSRWIAWKMRMAIAVLLTLLVFPMLEPIDLQFAQVFPAALSELLCGISLGLGVRLFISVLQTVGDLISQLTGWSLGHANEDGELASPLGNVFYWSMLAVFVACGGVNQFVAGIIDSCLISPPGTLLWHLGLADLASSLLQQSFELVLRVAAPAVTALLVATLVLAVVQRSAPTVNSFQVGFALKGVLAFAVASWMIARGPVLASQFIEPVMISVQQTFQFSTAENVGREAAEPQ